MVDTTKLKDVELDLTHTNQAEQDGPVECLGKTFANDENRRQYYLTILAEKLKDPEFRKISGFPIGEDDDILNLSDPPYYTACPNPWVADFIAEWGEQKPAKEFGYYYHREPFSADVSEGKNDPIYKAHSYHTKVPHKAIMRYILHYTVPGDIVFDGFAGTGMTGVAARMCGDRETVLSLGYQVHADGTILKEESDIDGISAWIPFSKLGVRHAVLNDLSPIATFIAYNYNTPIDTVSFEREANRILQEVEEECGWMYETLHTDGKSKGIINYTVWSDIFICHECGHEFSYWYAAVDKESAEVHDPFSCPNCSSEIKKRNAEKAYETTFDNKLSNTTKIVKQVPIFINYSIGRKRFEKYPDSIDLETLQKIDKSTIPYAFPSSEILKGEKTREPLSFGITHTHLFYTHRNLWIISAILNRLNLIKDKRIQNYLRVWFTSSQTRLHRMNRYAAKHRRHVGPLANTLYISSTPTEISPFYFFKLKIKEHKLALPKSMANVVSCGDASLYNIPENSLDYIFLDPPFGHNIMYSDLNILWESWLSVRTNSKTEAIENKSQGKSLDDYRNLMLGAFKKAYKTLKPGGWMTVEFSNTRSAVWNNIQIALSDAGFIVANVAALNKGRGGLHAIIGPTAVKQDLVISAYKPNGGFENRFTTESNEEGLWDFVRTHLGYLSISKKQGSELVAIPERDPRILFDQVVAYFVRNLRDVPLSSKEFQDGLLERFAERDGMIFLPEQVAQYDKARITSSQLRQLDIFVDDEASSIEWLRQLLNDKPQTYQDIHPKFINELSGWKKAELQLELSTLLEQNFIKFDGQGQLPPQIHSYLSTNFKGLRNLPKDDSALLKKAQDRWYVPNPEREEDLQKLRERSLLKQFEEYKTQTGKKIKLIRMEAVRCGFKKAWQEHDYATIITVAEKIPQNLLQEDQKLLMWYDQAQTRSGDSF